MGKYCYKYKLMQQVQMMKDLKHLIYYWEFNLSYYPTFLANKIQCLSSLPLSDRSSKFQAKALRVTDSGPLNTDLVISLYIPV